MSDKLPMTREQIEVEVAKCFPYSERLSLGLKHGIIAVAEHILRIGTIALREENKLLRSGEFICKKCGLREDADPFLKDGVPF